MTRGNPALPMNNCSRQAATVVENQLGLCRESRLGRESKLGRETSLRWEDRLCREGWLGIAY